MTDSISTDIFFIVLLVGVALGIGHALLYRRKDIAELVILAGAVGTVILYWCSNTVINGTLYSGTVQYQDASLGLVLQFCWVLLLLLTCVRVLWFLFDLGGEFGSKRPLGDDGLDERDEMAGEGSFFGPGELGRGRPDPYNRSGGRRR